MNLTISDTTYNWNHYLSVSDWFISQVYGFKVYFSWEFMKLMMKINKMTLPVSKYNSVTIILSAFVYASQIWWTLTMEATMVQKSLFWIWNQSPQLQT